MRIQHTKTAELLLQRESLGFELDSVGARDVGPDVHFSGGLEVGMPELEYDLRISDRKAVLVGDTAAQNERTVVKGEIPGIEKHHLPDSRSQTFEGAGGKAQIEILRDPTRQPAKVVKSWRRSKAIGLQDQFALKIVNGVERMPVTVGTGPEHWNPFHVKRLRLVFLIGSKWSRASYISRPGSAKFLPPAPALPGWRVLRLPADTSRLALGCPVRAKM